MKKLLVIALLVTACGGTPSSAPPGSQAAFAADTAAPTALPIAVAPTPTPSATPTPTPDPEAVRKAAATSYLAAASAYNKSAKALNKKYKTLSTLARVRAYYKGLAKIEGTFLAAIRKIPVPADTAGDLHSLVVKSAAEQAIEIEGSAVKSWARVTTVANALDKAGRSSAGAANLIRSDLGLPPVPAL